MKRFFSIVLLAALCLTLVPGLAEDAAEYQPLYTLAEPYGFKLGGAFGAQDMKNEAHLNMLSQDFNSVTCTNEMKAYAGSAG